MRFHQSYFDRTYREISFGFRLQNHQSIRRWYRHENSLHKAIWLEAIYLKYFHSGYIDLFKSCNESNESKLS